MQHVSIKNWKIFMSMNNNRWFMIMGLHALSYISQNPKIILKYISEKLWLQGFMLRENIPNCVGNVEPNQLTQSIVYSIKIKNIQVQQR